MATCWFGPLEKKNVEWLHLGVEVTGVLLAGSLIKETVSPRIDQTTYPLYMRRKRYR